MTAGKARTTRRTRNDPRREATRVAIIEAAESLFAESGIDGVSLRQIGAASGSSNTGVVAYHFGSKAALLEAIFHYRLPAIEARRGELLSEVQAAGQGGELLPLLRALWLPLYEQRDERGRHSYAGFLAALMRSSRGQSRLGVSEHYKVSSRLGRLIRAALPLKVRAHYPQRVNTSTWMITGALRLMEQAGTAGGKKKTTGPSGEAWFDDTLRMVGAALQAPPGA